MDKFSEHLCESATFRNEKRSTFSGAAVLL